MPHKIKTHAKEKDSRTHHMRKPEVRAAKGFAQQASPAQLLIQAVNDPSTLTPSDILALQQAAGNRAVEGILRHLPTRSSTPANVVQRQNEEEDTLQEKSEPARKEENRTGLPDSLKAGIENLSGISLDDVKVHYNSAKPAEVRALAFTRGTDIYLRPNQEEHLPHEAWHVVQQKQGRVKPTLQAKGMAINDDKGLEREADAMGEKATRLGGQLGGYDSIKNWTDQTTTAPVVKPNLHSTGGANVAQLREVGDLPTNSQIRFSANMTPHGHTDAEIRAAVRARWNNRVERADGTFAINWGGAASGILFHDNRRNIVVFHAQSGASISQSRRATRARHAARAAMGRGPDDGPWR